MYPKNVLDFIFIFRIEIAFHLWASKPNFKQTSIYLEFFLVVSNVSANMAIMGLNLKTIITFTLIQHDSGKEHNAMRYNRNETHREIGFS